MTDNLPAVAPSQPPAVPAARPPATTDVDSWVEVVADVVKLAQTVADTEFVPRALRGNWPAAAAAMLYGREVGLPPMTALNTTHVIEGRPSLSAEMMRALVLAAGHELEFMEANGGRCVMRARRAGTERWTTLEWNLDQARQAGLLTKKNWKEHPRAMLVARCTGDLCRMVFPDVIHGFRISEEFEDGEDDQSAPEAAAPTTKVARKRATKKAAPAAPAPGVLEAPKERPTPPPGPPLPGEDGYDAPTPAPEPVGPQTPEEVATAAHVSGEDVAAPSGTAEPEPTVEVESEPERGGSRPVTKAQVRMLMATLGEKFDLADDARRDERLSLLGALVGRRIESVTHLTTQEASRVIDTLSRLESLEQLERLAAGVAVEDPPEDAD